VRKHQPIGPKPYNPHKIRDLLRAECNRALLIAGLLVVLPAIVIANKLGRNGRHTALSIIRHGSKICGIEFEIRGKKHIHPGHVVVVANHSSLMDIPALLVAVPELKFMAAADLYRYPLLRSAMNALGTVPVDRRGGTGVNQLKSLAKRGLPGRLAVFPEGKIATPGHRLPFRTGAFALAIDVQCPIQPIVISGTSTVLPPKSRLLLNPGKIVVEVLPVITTTGLVASQRQQLAEKVEAQVKSKWDALTSKGPTYSNPNYPVHVGETTRSLRRSDGKPPPGKSTFSQLRTSTTSPQNNHIHRDLNMNTQTIDTLA